MELKITSGIDPKDISGGYWSRWTGDAGMPGAIASTNPRFIAALAFIAANFPKLTEAVLTPQLGPGRMFNPASIVFKTVDGPLPEVIDAMTLLLFPDDAIAGVYRGFYGIPSEQIITPTWQAFDAWYASAHPPPPPPPSASVPVVGPQDPDITEIFGAPSFSFAVNNSNYTKGQIVTEGGKTYEVKTLRHPLAERKFLVLKS